MRTVPANSAARLLLAGRAAACVGHGRGRAGQIRQLCVLSCASCSPLHLKLRWDPDRMDLGSLRPMDSAIQTGRGGARCCPSSSNISKNRSLAMQSELKVNYMQVEYVRSE